MAIVDIQRRLVEVGRIRMGDSEEVEGRGFRRPTRLSTWKLTSRDQARLLAAAEVFGGTVEPWDRKEGEWQLLTDTDALPIVVLPGQNLTQFYELWGQRVRGRGANECLRRCDGVNETLTDGECLCDPDSEKGRECKPTTRLSVLLPDVPGIGCWRLESHGYYAAVELGGTADLLEAVTAGGRLVPARLRIDQRKVVRGAETKSFPVPVIDIDVRLPEALALKAGTLGDARAIEQRPAYGALPAAGQTGVSVQEGLQAAARQAEPRATTARSAAPMGPVGDFSGDGHVPVPDETLDPTQPVVDASPAAPVRGPALTEAQAKKLNVQVGKLRTAGKITTEHLYQAVAKVREIEVDELVASLAEGARDAEGELHWGQLREALSKREATALIERLQALEEGPS